MERNIMYIEIANICYFGLVISGSKWDKQFLVFIGRSYEPFNIYINWWGCGW